MAQIAKDPIFWDDTELRAFNIQVIDVDVETFFGEAALPPPALSPVVVENLDIPRPFRDICAKADSLFFTLLEDALERISDQEDLPAGDFIAALINRMNYDVECGYRGVTSRNKEFQFEMYGNVVTDISVIEFTKKYHVWDFLLLLQQKRRFNDHNPEANLIGNTIAAFHVLNQGRKAAEQPEVKSKLYAGITACGTAPTFYKIPVTAQLLRSVATGERPEQVTTVERFVPPVPDPRTFTENAIVPLENRRIILQCFAALKIMLNGKLFKRQYL